MDVGVAGLLGNRALGALMNLMMSTIIMLVAGAMIIMTFVPLVLGASDRAVFESSRIQAEQIASIINSVQAAPDGFSHEYLLPKKQCTLRISDYFIEMETTKGVSDVYTFGLVQTDVTVADVEIKCDQTQSKLVYFIKCKNTVELRENAEKVCA